VREASITAERTHLEARFEPDPAPGHIKLQIVDTGSGRHTLCLSGELDSASTPEFELLLKDHVSRASEIVIDLQNVSFIDSSGLRAILVCQATCEHSGIAFHLTRGKQQVRRLFDTVGLSDRLPFIDSPPGSGEPA
jgi:anti-anti-sigma factor